MAGGSEGAAVIALDRTDLRKPRGLLNILEVCVIIETLGPTNDDLPRNPEQLK